MSVAGWLVVALAACVLAQAAEATEVGAGATARSVDAANGVLRTVGFRAGRVVVGAEGPEFRLCLGEAPRTVSSTDYRAEAAGGGLYKCTAQGLPTVEVEYTADARLGVVRKRITVRNSADAPILLRWAEVESLKPHEPVTYSVSPSFSQLGDWGQPVYTKHLFLGIEFPAARSCATATGALQMREYPGVRLEPGASWTSHTAVVGGSPSGAVQAAFYDYIAAISTNAPNVPRPNIYWNGFRVIMPPDRTSQGLKMVERARELKRLTGFAFDSWTYDAGFDMYVADALWVPQEPDIWTKTREALADIDTPVGFWTSFSCIFDVPTHAWGKTQGFGLQHPAAYCLAEPTYEHAMEERLSDIVRTYGMRSINFDGMYWGQGYGCNTPGHGHLVGEGEEAGVYGTYAVVVNEMRIFERLRREKPDICLDLFICNEWSSPWWLTVLDGVHTVPGDTVAAGIPGPWLRDDLITVRDIQVWEEHKQLRRQFPMWGEDLYGSQVRADHLIDGIEVTGEAMDARWEDELVMSLAARGDLGNYIVCSDLDVLAKSRSGLRFLGEVGNWVRANVEVYKHFALLGGDPARQETFGYAHGDGKGRAVVGLRNPSIRTQMMNLRITSAFSIGAPGPYQVTMVYPYRYTWPAVEANRSLPIVLADFQVAILEVRALSRRIPNAPDGRWREEDGKLFAAGPDVEPAQPKVEMSVADPKRAEIGGRVHIPEGTHAQLQLAVNPPVGTKEMKAVVHVDGHESPGSVHFRDRGSSQDAWVLADLSAGEHAVSVSLDCVAPTRLEGWVQYTVAREFQPTGQAAPAGLFPPLDTAEIRRTCPALAPTYVMAGVTDIPNGTVQLSAIRSRCVQSETYWGEIGWDQSCWKDDPTLRIGAKSYEHGLGVHAPGRFVFVLDGKDRTLKADIGVHPIPVARRAEGWPRGSVRFRVEADGKTVFISPVLRETDGAKPISVRLKGVRILSLLVDDGGDGPFDDLCTWGDVRLER